MKGHQQVEPREPTSTRLVWPLGAHQCEISIETPASPGVIILNVVGYVDGNVTESVQLYLDSAEARQVALALNRAAEIYDRPEYRRSDTCTVFRF